MADSNDFPRKTSRGSNAKAGSRANSTYTDPPKGDSATLDPALTLKDIPRPATEPVSSPSRPPSIRGSAPYGLAPPAFRENVTSAPGLFLSDDGVADWLDHAVAKDELGSSPNESNVAGSRHSRSIEPKEEGSFNPRTPSTGGLSNVSNPVRTPPELRTAKRDFPVGYDQHNRQPYDLYSLQEHEWSRPNVYPHFMVRFARPRDGWTGELWDDFFQSELEQIFSRDYQVMSVRFDKYPTTYERLRTKFEKHLGESDVHHFVTSKENTRTDTVMRLGGDTSPSEVPGEASNKAFVQEVSNRLQRVQTEYYRQQSGGVDSNLGSPIGSTKPPSLAEAPPASLRSGRSRTSSESSQSSKSKVTAVFGGKHSPKTASMTRNLGKDIKTAGPTTSEADTPYHVQGLSTLRQSSKFRTPQSLSKAATPSPSQARVATPLATASREDLSSPSAEESGKIIKNLRNAMSRSPIQKCKLPRGQ